jgi:hypothetical protein
LTGQACVRARQRPGDPAARQDRIDPVRRVAVGALRSAMIRYRELQDSSQGDSPSVGELLDRAFAIIAEQAPWSP